MGIGREGDVVRHILPVVENGHAPHDRTSTITRRIGNNSPQVRLIDPCLIVGGIVSFAHDRYAVKQQRNKALDGHRNNHHYI